MTRKLAAAVLNTLAYVHVSLICSLSVLIVAENVVLPATLFSILFLASSISVDLGVHLILFASILVAHIVIHLIIHCQCSQLLIGCVHAVHGRDRSVQKERK